MNTQISVIIACILLVSFLLYNEIRRPNKSRLALRVLATILAVSTFALLVVPVTYQTSTNTDKSEINIITEGSLPDSVQKLTGVKYVLSPDLAHNKSYTTLADLSYFLDGHPEIKTIHLYGDGLPEHELKNLNNYQIVYHQGTDPEGITSASWPHQIKATEKLIVQGFYRNPKNNSIKLIFKGLGKTLDSVIIPPKSAKGFSFKDQPKLLGKAVYQIISLQKNDTLFNEPVPFEVTTAKPLNVLMLASFPDFEYKFLRNWLYENKFPLAYRSRISKDKFTTDFLNIDRFTLQKLSSNSLKQFDLLLIDEEELATISSEERNLIALAVDRGMGIIVRVSELKASNSLSNLFSRFETSVTKNKPLTVLVNRMRLSKLPIEQTLFLKSDQRNQVIVADQTGKTLVASTLRGQGRVVNTTINSTYQWLLSGKKNDYFTFWSEILTQAARKEENSSSFELSPQFPTVNQKARIEVNVNESDKIPELRINGSKLSPRQNRELPFQWDAYFWPVNSAWTNLDINQKPNQLYIYGNSDWLAAKKQRTIEANLSFSKNNSQKKKEGRFERQLITKRISIWWFFAAFLLAMTYLWYESKVLAAK